MARVSAGPIDPPPLVVTLQLEQSAQAHFDALRLRHFPTHRNHLAAHVTLFHAVPGEHEQQVRLDLRRLADTTAYGVRVRRVRSLGGGVAYDLVADELSAQHRELARCWQPWLTRQDARPLSAHVTVQNKVSAEQARSLLAELAAGFTPYDVRATGLALWRYAGGPWEALASWDFGGFSEFS